MIRTVICIVVCLSVGMLLSCEKEVTLSSEFLEKKLVVQSFISPQDTLITVLVSTTSPLVGKLDSMNRWVTNANVVLSDGQRDIVLGYTKRGNYSYRVSPAFSIEPGKTYALRVSTPEGQSASSSCTVPTLRFGPQDIMVEKQVIDGQKFRLTITWPVQPNYKNGFGLWTGVDKSAIQCSSAPTSYLIDSGMKNTTLHFTTGLFFNVCNPDHRPISIILSVFDKNFYDFYNALDQQTQTNGVPFTEPVQLPTNIDGGYGIFSSHNTLQKTVLL